MASKPQGRPSGSDADVASLAKKYNVSHAAARRIRQAILDGCSDNLITVMASDARRLARQRRVGGTATKPRYLKPYQLDWDLQSIPDEVLFAESGSRMAKKRVVTTAVLTTCAHCGLTMNARQKRAHSKLRCEERKFGINLTEKKGD